MSIVPRIAGAAVVAGVAAALLASPAPLLAQDNLSASDNTPIRALDPAVGETGLVMQRFRVDSDTAGDGVIELTSLRVDEQGTAQTVDIATVSVYIDVDLDFDGSVQIGTVAFGADPQDVPLTGGTVADRTITNPSSKYLWIVYDLASGATAGRTLQSRVTQIDVAGPDTGLTGLTLDSNLLTIVAAQQNGTSVTGSEAFVSACSPTGGSTGQITVISRFTGDADDDGSVSVVWDTDSNPGGGGTPACDTLTGPSPRHCLVTGLQPSSDAGANYWIEVTFSDLDGVGGTNPETLGGGGGFNVPDCGGTDTAAPTVLILSPWRDAVIGGTERIKVQVYENASDEGGLAATDPVQWAVDGGTLAATGVSVNPNYDCGTDCAIYEFDLDTTTVNGGLTDDRHRLIIQVADAATPGNVARVEQAFRVRNLGTTPGGSGQLLRRTPGSRLCIDCHDLPTHSSQTTSTDYGNWAMACSDCHKPHGTTNIFLFRDEVRTPSSGKRRVRFENQTGAAGSPPDTPATVDNPGAASFVNEDAGTAGATLDAEEGPCQTCHTRTQSSSGQARWRNIDSGNNVDTHYVSASVRACTQCHQHTVGFQPAGGGACDGCHFGGTRVADSRRDIQADFSNTNRSHHVGNAGSTMGGTLTNFDCVVCHAEGTINAQNETDTTEYHNDTGSKANCSQATTPRPCIDLKDADNWDNSDPGNTAVSFVFRYDKQLLVENLSGGTPGTTPGNWGSGDADWRTETSNRLDPFCLTCHDFDGATDSRNADATECGTPDALNPFCDTTISNEYDQYDRGRVTDIASRVARAWRTGPSGAYTGTDRDQAGEARYDEAPTGADGILDPPLGIYSRHAIRGVALSDGGFSGSASVYASSTDANGDIPAAYWTSTTWEDNSVMGCADCHTVDGANHTSGNAHGSTASEYLLKDANGAATLGTREDPTYTYICWRCHEVQRYNRGLGGFNHTDNDGDWANTVGDDGANRVGNDGNIFGMACTGCHGGVESGTQASPVGPEFGTIHGTSQSYGIGENGGSGTRLAYRFMNGNNLRYYDPNGWSGNVTVSCYTIDRNEEDSFGACSQHDRTGKGWDKPVDRDLKY